MRLTRERETIVEEVFSSHEHFDTDQLVSRLANRTDGKRVRRATVYRTLDEVVEWSKRRAPLAMASRWVYPRGIAFNLQDAWNSQLVHAGTSCEFHCVSVGNRMQNVLSVTPRE